MGYAHYWDQKRDYTPAQFDDIGRQLRAIIKEATGKPTTTAGNCYPDDVVTIHNYDGEGRPTITSSEISFNGCAPTLDHESFYITAERDPASWQFCKTARKPYDVVVVALLTLLAADYGFEVSSDGDVEDWEAGVALAEKALDRPFANPLVVEQLLS